MEKFARRCDATGKGMNEGWYINGSYYENQEDADARARQIPNEENPEAGNYKDFKELYDSCDEDSDFCYWTQWTEEDCEDEWYDADGNLYMNCPVCTEEIQVSEEDKKCPNCLTNL